jgi:DNA polymerase-3 subunit beta
MKLTIKAETIKALLAVAAKSDIRYYLNSIAIDARATGDVTLVATDGHRMLAVPVDKDDIENLLPGVWVVDRALLESVKPVKAGRTEFPLTLTLAGVSAGNPPNATVQLTGATTASGTTVDGRFPDWRRVVPASADGIASQFSPEYVGSFGKVGELLGGKSKSIPCVIHHNGNGAALVTFPGSPAIGVIMPMRVSADTSTPPHPGLPAWALAATSLDVKIAA